MIWEGIHAVLAGEQQHVPILEAELGVSPVPPLRAAERGQEVVRDNLSVVRSSGLHQPAEREHPVFPQQRKELLDFTVEAAEAEVVAGIPEIVTDTEYRPPLRV